MHIYLRVCVFLSRIIFKIVSHRLKVTNRQSTHAQAATQPQVQLQHSSIELCVSVPLYELPPLERALGRQNQN